MSIADEQNNAPIINIITAKLPRELAVKIYNEFQSRSTELVNILEHSEQYNSLGNYIETLKTLLALSVFHKRVICNLEGVDKFSGTISTKKKADITIDIGKYKLTTGEQNKIKAVLINYNELKLKFGIADDYFNYYETYEFLENMLRYQKSFDYDESPDPEKEINKNKRKRKSNQSEDDVPF
ncbi:MAG: hypothetical protein PHT07_03885 [Paludibacter sp.]|nr:hypothetical protein [Paludibacter sp.]